MSLLFGSTRRGARGNRPSSAVRLNRASPLTRGLVAFVPLNGETRDLVGLIGAPSAVNGPTPTGNPVGGQAYAFLASSDQYVNLGNPPALNFASAFTVNFWMSLGATSGILVSKDKETGGRSFTLDVNGGNLRFYVNGAANGLLSTTAPGAGVPTMVTASWDSGTSTPTILRLNGRTVATGTDGSSFGVLTSTANVLIARRDYSGATDAVDATIWDVAFWNRPLTDQEAWALYDPSTRHDLHAVPAPRAFFDLIAGGGVSVIQAFANMDGHRPFPFSPGSPAPR